MKVLNTNTKDWLNKDFLAILFLVIAFALLFLFSSLPLSVPAQIVISFSFLGVMIALYFARLQLPHGSKHLYLLRLLLVFF